MKEIQLQGAAWQVKGFWPWVPIKSVSMELGQELLGICEWLPATVPGGVHFDLYEAGLIPNPYYELNSLQCEWVENRWWMYRTTIDPIDELGEKFELVFKGLDYEAIIYVNGVRLGEHKGMFTEAVVDITDMIAQRQPIEIAVLLLHAPDEMGQIGKTSETFTQKSRFNYKWDFSTRLVNIGIWDGEQPLYRVTIELYSLSGNLLCTQSFQTGIRKLEYEQNEGSPSDALPYTIRINGQRIYIRGANLAPLDHLYGNVKDGQYDWMIYMMKQANMNLVRIWGGGLIEKHRLYEQCDRHGILIWQEFMQSSSGVDNIPSKKPLFLELLRQSAIAALRTRRNYTSLTVWSGGNELMSEPNKPSGFEDANLAMLRQLVEQYDPQRLCLPTSASGPVQYITDVKGLGHDVHGHWKYMDNPEHYRFYGENDNLFHSEFGVDGLSSVKSLRKFLSPEQLVPASMKDNRVWRHHGEWWDTWERDRKLFGELADIEQFSAASQWVQAEGIRFILEANRRRKFRNSGSIIWQMSEPWPNVSCTNLLDYYGETKMSYYWTKQPFSPVHVSLDYRSLGVTKGEAFAHRLYLHSHQSGVDVHITVEIADTAGRIYDVLHYEAITAHEQAQYVGEIPTLVPDMEEGLVLVNITYRSKYGTQYFYSKYGVVDQADYWYIEHGGERPIDVLIDRSLGGQSVRMFNQSTKPIDTGFDAGLFQHVSVLQAGELSRSFYFNGHVYVLECLERDSGGYMPFNEVKAVLQLQYAKEQYEEHVQQQLERASIEVEHELAERIHYE
ncbi:hypothetical protein M6D81_09090 [Paenibacillus sp. J5C_2022]|uniref:glycosyl hydrolase 2 galactose-binding domain-containing protein n=1 Tax=Paenibacillus sp. J5C2022 TaxID=2977129 RepID=UPI0021D223FF|nr:glycoside hydrolase family 2 TIM barrel-domain containing protein [Paenibacillus sp. J5C2022]MCU6708875.1 hypothetical protein [Paenibacillus sp. J5C2022]